MVFFNHYRIQFECKEDLNGNNSNHKPCSHKAAHQLKLFNLDFSFIHSADERIGADGTQDQAISFKNILQPAHDGGFDVHAPITTLSHSMLSCAAKHTAWLHVSGYTSRCPQSCCRLSLHLQSGMHNQAEPEEKILGQ